ncbi:2-polyprenyl-3-methyl-5-hydroxy-6-metoxy-1,4-benzoquinol methylase [Rubricella aquisinus]|uniref:2-polyprenyl-3-methyl-5-hydroxy-6-metoxy-1, 4-benzoquinol methylase n=1 Tax=Rubricella aquisinus TaxID=2028108 RepID=A0A840X5R3_9RHOB|nr:class I SAM-dependent methyltransferase [Rubricella aquisinus]MBB5516047.1 2-polyprenyl-3-methyl-5-hydroxy-6-metoxy-1,4-benzoquinol methylase [Rubricella aquisinus]
MVITQCADHILRAFASWPEAALCARDTRLLAFCREVTQKPALANELGSAWRSFEDDLFLQPGFLDFLLPLEDEAVRAAQADLARLQIAGVATPDRAEAQAFLRGLAAQTADPGRSLLESSLVSCFRRRGLRPRWPFYARFLLITDAVYQRFVDDVHAAVFARLVHQQFLQRRHWPTSYCGGYFYQGSAALGIRGVKPSEERYEAYQLDRYLTSDSRVLDIGGNAGFLAAKMAQRAAQVDMIELNPFLVRVADEVKSALSLNNLRTIVDDFQFFDSPAGQYDVVVSLSNHATIDTRLSIDFHAYIDKIARLLAPGGLLIFESHNINGPGRGLPGDDGDIEDKIAYMQTRFEVLDRYMVDCWVPALDIDKLFLVLRKA